MNDENLPATDEDTVDPTLSEPGAPVSVEDAKSMFGENPGLAAVLTTAGFLHRDGTLTEQ